MRKRRNVGKRLSIFTIALAFVVVFMGLWVFNKWLSNRSNKTNQELIATVDGIKTVKASELYYDNYWSKSIVTNVVEENVPIPEGAEYVSGTKDTGVIVKDKTTGNQMLWIPYDSTVTEESASQYYQNCEDAFMDVDSQESIALYGGFYVLLEENNQYEALKQVDNAAYAQAYEQAQNIYKDSETMNSHLLSKTELAQVLAYSQKIGINLTQTKAGSNAQHTIKLTSATGEIALPSNVNPGVVAITVEIYEGSQTANTTIIEFDKDELSKVVVPGGFEICTNLGVVMNINNTKGVNAENHDAKILKIRDEVNPYLRYVWVPVAKDTLTKMRSTLEHYYTQNEKELEYNEVTDMQNQDYLELLDSVETFGGFYIAEAELGYWANGQVINVARGMKTDKESGWETVNSGEYYRGTEIGTFDRAVEIASSVHSDNYNVKSHLMYGAEWDATMIWLLSTGAISAEQMVVDSSSAGGAKYQNTIADQLDENGELEDIDLKGLNGIYGLAGNLTEITQETLKVKSYDDETKDETIYVSTRGGSYLYPGNDYPLASRLPVKNENISLGQDIGFRNCLYLDEEAIFNAKYFNISENGEISIKDEYKKGKKSESNMVKELEIPSTLNGITVTSIAEEGFSNCNKLEVVILPDTITNIKESAFYNCTSLKNVEMSKNITGIASYAFGECESLKSIVIPAETQTIYTHAFENCKAMTEVVIYGDKLVNIQEEAFRNCENINSVTVGETLEKLQEIHGDAFEGCNAEKTLNVVEDMSNSTRSTLKEKLGNVNEKINDMVSHKILMKHVELIGTYSEGYIYGPVNEEGWAAKVTTMDELEKYYIENRLTINSSTMETELTNIRQKGEKAIEDLFANYRSTAFKTEVEEYVNKYHSDLLEDEWVKQQKENINNIINNSNNMKEVYDLVIQFQIDLEKKVNDLNDIKIQYDDQIGQYIPYTGWLYVDYWYTHVNSEIKAPARAKILSAKTEEEALDIKLQCEKDIETYVSQIVNQKNKEAYDAAVARQKAGKSSSASYSSGSKKTAYSSGSKKYSGTESSSYGDEWDKNRNAEIQAAKNSGQYGIYGDPAQYAVNWGFTSNTKTKNTQNTQNTQKKQLNTAWPNGSSMNSFR